MSGMHRPRVRPRRKARMEIRDTDLLSSRGVGRGGGGGVGVALM